MAAVAAAALAGGTGSSGTSVAAGGPFSSTGPLRGDAAGGAVAGPLSSDSASNADGLKGHSAEILSGHSGSNLGQFVAGGCSLGCATALTLATLDPGAVAGLVLCLPPIAWEARPAAQARTFIGGGEERGRGGAS